MSHRGIQPALDGATERPTRVHFLRVARATTGFAAARSAIKGEKVFRHSRVLGFTARRPARRIVADPRTLAARLRFRAVFAVSISVAVPFWAVR